MNLSRKLHLCPRVIFTPSIPGSGKSLIGATLMALERVEIRKLNPIFEFLCDLLYLKKIEEDAAIAMMRLLTDAFFYDIMISRDINFRPGDLTSVVRYPNPSKYINRLFMPDGEAVLQRIESERPLIQNTSHMMLSVSDPVIKALGDRWFFVETFRHPIFLVHHWHCYVDRFGKDPREFTVCFDYKGQDVPWFTMGWEKEFLEASTMDKAILCVNFLQRRHLATYEKLKSEFPKQITGYAFENFVVNPWPVIEELESLLETKRSDKMEAVLKDQKIPREIPTDGPSHTSWITGHGQTELPKNASAESEYERHWAVARKHASPARLCILEELCNVYEDKFFRK